KTYDIFGQGGARTKSEELNVPFLGCLPIDITLRTAGDEGKLAEVIASNEKARAPFDGVAKAMVREVAFQTSQKPNQGSLPVL
ncbi:MAG: P-loop NTPase, partial [Planctomycetota bacterium]|nr:P-loop NTPase [Planctomycetota bacterium]